ncbi:MAG: Rpn family recombination-promoting nuclease/putative transposase [Tannerella sp.]|jgi:predicted transposase/invertase (TIGR01784 family)|nr:Rpn family recombination-promoting nuclease/putative transposase [Tannerella sp.]
MARYLDPKNDLIFRRIFGEHPRLLVSFLNALMPLASGRLIESVEYLSPKQVPETPLKNNSIVDVKCIDSCGQQFIVEMHVFWSEFFNRRLVFNASKAYVRQLNRNESYRLLQPVYGLGIINEVFDHKTTEFYHHYQTVNRSNTDEVIEGLEFVLVELPKFEAEKWVDRRMAVLWLRFLSEVEDRTENISPDLLENEEIKEALTLCEEAAFTKEELEWYEHYWDLVRTEKGLVETAKAEGLAKGLERTVLTAYQNNFSIEQIRMFSGLNEDAILEILKRNDGMNN